MSNTLILCLNKPSVNKIGKLIYIMRDGILNDKQREVLYITQEECAEVTQAVSKIFRFGFDMRYPVDGASNREKLTEEVGDLVAMIRLLVDFGIDPIEKPDYLNCKDCSDCFKENKEDTIKFLKTIK